MRSLPSSGDHRGRLVMVVTALLTLAGCALILRAFTTPGAPPQPNAAAATSAPPRASDTAPALSTPTRPKPMAPKREGSFGPILQPSPPVTLVIPSIGVRTSGIVDLHLDPHGKLEAPTDFDRAGWYADGPTPGEFGPAVIGAHVDSKSGPAVFYRLGSLQKGAAVDVTRKDGNTARFVVDRVARYSKQDFPTATVYGDTKGRAELRLITCGGAFDTASGHYVDNIVAYAHLTS